jgi:hypothetical protein
MKEYKYGKINDAHMYATEDTYGLKPIKARFINDYPADKVYKIYFDAGVYPGIVNVEEYIAHEASKELGLDFMG